VHVRIAALVPRRAREAAVVARRKRFGKQTLNVNPKLLLNKGRVHLSYIQSVITRRRLERVPLCARISPCKLMKWHGYAFLFEQAHRLFARELPLGHFSHIRELHHPHEVPDIVCVHEPEELLQAVGAEVMQRPRHAFDALSLRPPNR